MYCELKQLALWTLHKGAHLVPDAVYTRKHTCICVLVQLVHINNALEQ